MVQSENTARAQTRSQDFWAIVGEQRLWLLAIVLLALLLRFYQIGQQSFWTDEVRSIWVFTRPKQCLHFDMHGPLHAVLVVLWSIWGGLDTAWTRALSALIGVGTVPLFYVLVRRLGGARVALTASFLLAISPFHVWYSQEMRNYALLIGMLVLCQVFFMRLLDGGGRRAALGYFLGSLLVVLSNLSGCFLLMAQGFYLLLCRRDLLGRYVLIQLAVALVIFPWLRNYQNEWAPDMIGRSGVHRQTNFHPLALPFAASVFSVGFTAGPSLDEMNRGLSLGLFKPYMWYFVSVALLYGFLFLRGAATRLRRREGWIYYGLWLGVPTLCVSALAILNVKAFNPRYMAAAYPAYLILLAYGADLRARRWRALLLVLLAVACGLSLWNHYHNPRYWKPDARSAARYVAARALPEDAVYAYAHGDAFYHYYHRWDGAAPLDIIPGEVGRRAAAREAFVAELAERYGRVWLVEYRGWYIDPQDHIPQAFARGWRQTDAQSYAGTRIFLYENPAGPAGRSDPSRGPDGAD